MSLRDWFAGQAMQTILAAHLSGVGRTSYGAHMVEAYISADAYYHADAMLAARKEAK
jgi:hypothetical protein